MKLNQLMLIAALFSSPAFAHEPHAHSAAHAMTDAQAIEHNMKKLFDKPDAPLAVAPSPSRATMRWRVGFSLAKAVELC